jgi:hypothetical protein
MLSSGANVSIWCYHVMLSSGMITHTPFLVFLKTSLTLRIPQQQVSSSPHPSFHYSQRCYSPKSPQKVLVENRTWDPPRGRQAC